MSQCPYANVVGGAGKSPLGHRVLRGFHWGSPNTPKTFWNTDKGVSAAKARNCATISASRCAEMFRVAGTFIVERASRASRSGT